MPRTPAQAIGFLLGLWLALWLSPFRADAASGEAPPLASFEAELHARVESVRAQHHLVPLERLEALDRVARAHAEDMARRGYLAHESPEGDSPVDRLARGGVDGFTLAAENIGMTSRSDPAVEIVTSWLASPDHRRALLAPVFNHTGIGAARAADGSIITTQLYVTYPRP